MHGFPAVISIHSSMATWERGGISKAPESYVIGWAWKVAESDQLEAVLSRFTALPCQPQSSINKLTFREENSNEPQTITVHLQLVFLPIVQALNISRRVQS